MFAPVSVQVPVPFLVTLVAPVLSPITAARVLAPVLLPVSVRVLAAVPPLKPIEPVFVKFTAAFDAPEASIVLLDCNENRRSVLTAAPVYWSVPPLRMRLPAVLVEAPMLLLLPPSASEETLSVPAVIVVAPV